MDAASEILRHETFLTLAEASRAIPSHPHYNTLCKWIKMGIRASNGQLCFLESRMIGGVRFVSVQAIERFLNKINEE